MPESSHPGRSSAHQGPRMRACTRTPWRCTPAVADRLTAHADTGRAGRRCRPARHPSATLPAARPNRYRISARGPRQPRASDGRSTCTGRARRPDPGGRRRSPCLVPSAIPPWTGSGCRCRQRQRCPRRPWRPCACGPAWRSQPSSCPIRTPRRGQRSRPRRC